MTTVDYLPRGDKTNEIAGVLDGYLNNLYFVGSGARKKIYDLKSSVDDFDFVLDMDPNDGCFIFEDITEAGFKQIGAWGYNEAAKVDCNGYDVKIRVQPIADFLLETLYAGDGMAVRVKDGRMICTPEFVTVPPTFKIRKMADDEVPYKETHLATLQRFEDDILAMGQQLQQNEPKPA